MGIYTSNRYFGEAYDYAAEIPANEAYDAAFGCAHILADCQANDMALFESSIYSDMQEVMAVQEGYQIVNEGAFANVIKKIVEMFKKLLAKIKGIFSAFLAKLAGAFKNGKDLVKKYEKQILKCASWKGLKIKGIRKPASGKENIKTAIYGTSGAFNFTIADIYTFDISNGKNADQIYAPTIGGTATAASKIQEMDTEELKLALLKTYINSAIHVTDFKELSENISDWLYQDEDTLDGEDGVNSQTFTATWVKGVLMDEKWESEVRKTNDAIDKIINKIIDDLNKTHNKLIDFMQKEGETAKIKTSDATGNTSFNLRNNTDSSINKDSKAGESKAKDFAKDTTNAGSTASDLNKAIQACQKVASNDQEVITRVTSEYMAQVKFAMSQARKLWTAAAAWSSTTHKESVEYYQAVGEAAAEQFYANVEAIGA